MALIFTNNELASLKETAIDRYVADVYPNNVLLSHIQREPMGGSPHPLAIKISGASIGGVFTNAIATAREVGRLEAKLNERLIYSIGYVNGPGSRSSKGAGKKAIVDLAKDCESDTKMRGSSMLEKYLISSTGFGEFFAVASHTGTTGTVTITLKNPADALFIKKNDKLQFKDVANTATLRTGDLLVTGVDSQTGIVTGTGEASFDASAGSTIDGAVGGFNGDLTNTTAQSGIIGLPGWLNRTSMDVDGLLTADRTSNPQETSGWVTTGNLSVRDSINLMGNQTFQVSGANPSIVLVGTQDFQDLQDDLGDRVVIQPDKGTVPVNFDGIKFLTAKGKPVMVYPTPALQKDRYMLDPKSLHLVTPEAEIWQPIANYGDRGFRTLENADALRLDLGFQGAFGISHPAGQARYTRN
jgi:hypothetical protein